MRKKQRGEKTINEKKLINLTPHSISIVDNDGKIVKIIESSGIARCKEESSIIGSINSFDVIQMRFGEVYGLPENKDDVVYIVSCLVAQAEKGRRNDLLVPGEFFRDKDGKIIGCKNFCRI